MLSDMEGESGRYCIITVDDAEARLYENAVFQSFSTRWTDCMRRISMAMLSRGTKGACLSTGDLARWIGYPEEEVRRWAQVLGCGMIQVFDNDMWKSVYN